MAATQKNAVFLKACRREQSPFTPIWLMRQAGRYMKEYRDVRAKVGFLELCKTPELACEVTVTAAENIAADAAIIFADILLITEPLGFKLEFSKDDGPVIANPFRTESDALRLREFSARQELSCVLEAIRLARSALAPTVPLIGFAGAPFTVASYVIEGGKSKSFEKTKVLMEHNPNLWNSLLMAISHATVDYLSAQIEAGADAIQLFDSWVGTLSAREYRDYVLPHVKTIFDGLPKGVPAIYFGTNTGHLLSEMKKVGASVMGLDSGVALDRAWDEVGDMAVQGNLDPVILLENRDVIAREAKRILREANGRPGHIFNLGHGVLPATSVENVRFLINFVREESAR